MNKVYISAQELLESSFKLANQVFEDGFRPHFIVGVWRGGAPIGIAVQEYYEYRGVSTDHISVKTASYTGINEQSRDIKVFGLEYLIEHANAAQSLLIVDDVFDTGRSVEALIQQIKEQSQLSDESDIRVACAWYKPDKRSVNLKPDYYEHKSEEWLVFPHELAGLSKKEIVEGKPDLKNISELF